MTLQGNKVHPVFCGKKVSILKAAFYLNSVMSREKTRPRTDELRLYWHLPPWTTKKPGVLLLIANLTRRSLSSIPHRFSYRLSFPLLFS